MKVEVHGIGSEVFFINDKHKIDSGYITEVYFEMKRSANSDGYSSPITQYISYCKNIDVKLHIVNSQIYEIVFESRKELIDSL